MKHNIPQLKAKLMFNGFYEGLLMKKMRKKKIMKEIVFIILLIK